MDWAQLTVFRPEAMKSPNTLSSEMKLHETWLVSSAVSFIRPFPFLDLRFFATTKSGFCPFALSSHTYLSPPVTTED